MCHFVIVKIGRGCKGLATHLALVWLLSSVDPTVRVQAGAGAEPLVAEVALVGPLVRVQHAVLGQRLLRRQRLPADVANLRKKLPLNSLEG